MRGGVPRRRSEDVLDGEIWTLAGRAFSHLAPESRIGDWLYWNAAERYYRARCSAELDSYLVPPDPFKLEWVDPITIRRHTRREYPPWQDRLRRFGEVRAGDWDRRGDPEVDPTYDGPPMDLFIAECFEESVLYRSFRAHFDGGVDWEDTPLFGEVRRLLRAGDRRHVWHGCQSIDEVRDRFRDLDRLYESVRQRGVESQLERVRRDPERGFRDWLRAEITVDVGRDGELLLVCGKHRLAIAKLCSLERVPVLFLVRHPEWMVRRREAIRTPSQTDHPDLRDIPNEVDS
ncbi:MAG: hypothetical protein ACQET5_05390 [Halobacteriota archaeon]